MKKNSRLLANDLLLSMAAVLTFLGAERFITMQGYNGVGWLIGLVGIIFLVYAERFDRAIPTELINKRIIITLGNVLIFISLKLYLDPLLDNFWWLLLIIGFLIINKSYWLAGLKKDEK